MITHLFTVLTYFYIPFYCSFAKEPTKPFTVLLVLLFVGFIILNPRKSQRDLQ